MLTSYVNFPLTDGLLGPNEIKEMYPLSLPLTFVLSPLAEDPERQSPEPLEQERQAEEEEEGRERPGRGRQRGSGLVPDVLGKVS